MLYEAPSPRTGFNIKKNIFWLICSSINLSHGLLTILLTVEFTIVTDNTEILLYLVAICSEITYDIIDNLVLSTLSLQSAPSEW